ncbi:MAG: hypothetical protein R6V36_05365 [Psychroflexus sp.]
MICHRKIPKDLMCKAIEYNIRYKDAVTGRPGGNYHLVVNLFTISPQHAIKRLPQDRKR